MIRLFCVLAAFLSMVTVAWAEDAPVPAPAKAFIYKLQASDIVIGENKAPVTIVEYASLSCPHCAHFYTESLPELKKKYIDTGKAKLVYRDYPINAAALDGAKLLQCVDKERRHTFLTVLFTTQSKWAYDANYKDSLANIAALGGIDRSKFDACMADKAIEKSVLQTAKVAQDDYKLNSTPSFFINGAPYTGDRGVEPMSKAIEETLAKDTKK
jgi:protein-disulfide isomerase